METLKKFLDIVSGKAPRSYALCFSGIGSSETRQRVLEMLAERYCENPQCIRPFLDGTIFVDVKRDEIERLIVNCKEVARLCNYQFQYKRVPE